MISDNTQIIGKLPGNRVLISKQQRTDDSGSELQKTIDRLKSRDREVRLHEMSHSTNPDLIKIGPSHFDYTIGPDGKAYATGGNVILSTGNSRTPEEALSKARALKQASMAPGEPSSMDFQALNAALSMEFEALSQVYTGNKKFDKTNLSFLKGKNLNFYA